METLYADPDMMKFAITNWANINNWSILKAVTAINIEYEPLNNYDRTETRTKSGTNTGTVTSVRVQAGTGLSSSTSTAQNTTLNTTISIASGYKLPTTTEWDSKQDALPTQSGNEGKFLTTNGSTMSWQDHYSATFVDWSD